MPERLRNALPDIEELKKLLWNYEQSTEFLLWAMSKTAQSSRLRAQS
jgi:hypothetical protein